ncbi:MAG: SMC-Scp complex subunit ScpB [Planctomycetota bacterium]|jgi:segregation and condensation protein B
MADLKKQIEALLFASDEPLSLNRLHSILPDSKPAEIRTALEALGSDCADRAVSLKEIANGYQLLTDPDHAGIIAGLRKARSERKLSNAALETLAIVAYRQPVKRADVEAVRGVQSGEILRALLERGLIRIAGRENVPGNPILYGTSDEFLRVFGLASVKDLPKPEEVQ